MQYTNHQPGIQYLVQTHSQVAGTYSRQEVAKGKVIG